MLFNSGGLRIVLLPAALSGFYLLATLSHRRRPLLVSLASYGDGDRANALIIVPSIVINFALA
jgi:hypothetical protein